MPETDKHIEQAVSKFHHIMESLRGGGHEEIAAIATHTEYRLNMPLPTRELHFSVNLRPGALPQTTNFILYRVGADPDRSYVGVLVVDYDALFTLPLETLKADTVRTIAVANEFPANGYERRLRSVYQDAINKQIDWLHFTEQSTPSPSLLDPRTTDHQEMIRRLIGDARYYTDTGFIDWQNEIKRIQTTLSHDQWYDKLTTLLSDKATFLVLREQFAQVQYDEAVQFGSSYFDLGDELRAKATAVLLAKEAFSHLVNSDPPPRMPRWFDN